MEVSRMEATMAPASSINYWPAEECAKVFWSQCELPPYQELLAHTREWLDPKPDQTWLDLGCGCGNLTRELWTLGQGRLRRIHAMDVASVNERAYAKMRAELNASPQQIAFRVGDFSNGLPFLKDESLDGVVSGLSLQYAESYDEATGWTEDGYDRILGEIYRVLRPGRELVFSVNVPHAAWHLVAKNAVRGVLEADRPWRYLRRAWRLWSYGSWLTRESARGRFHYLPWESLEQKLMKQNFVETEHRISYAGQAYLIRAKKPH